MTTTNPVVLRALRWLGHQEWIRPGVRYRIIRTLCDFERVASHPFEVEFHSLRYPGNLNCLIDWMVYFFGTYEKYELLLLRDLVKTSPNPVFIDVGANIGHHTLFMSQYCAQVHAFEPYEPVRRELERRVKLNSAHNVLVHPVGFGAEDALLDYFAPQGANTGSGSFVELHDTTNNVPAGRLQVLNADACVASLGLEALHLVKIDVEGFEKSVLAGLRTTLARYRPFVFMEFSPTTRRSFRDRAEMEALLPNGYVVRRLQTHTPIAVFFCRPGVRLVDFDFDAPDATHLLLVPRERADVVPVYPPPRDGSAHPCRGVGRARRACT